MRTEGAVRSARSLPLRVRGKVAIVPLYVPLAVAGFFFILPFIWMVTGAFKTPSQIVAFPPTWLPRPFTMTNFDQAWTSVPIVRYAINSAIIALGSTLGMLMSCSLTGYGFARFHAPGRNVWFVVVLATLMIPYYVTIIPQYVLFQKLGWLNTYLPLIVPSFFGVGGGLYIFLMRQFFLSLPRELDEAAVIDGASAFGTFWRIALPLARPALIVVALFQFVAGWNDFFAPLVYLTNSSLYTLPVGTAIFEGAHTGYIGPLMAMSTVTVLPVLIVFLCAQRFFVQGIATTGLTGGAG